MQNKKQENRSTAVTNWCLFDLETCMKYVDVTNVSFVLTTTNIPQVQGESVYVVHLIQSDTPLSQGVKCRCLTCLSTGSSEEVMPPLAIYSEGSIVTHVRTRGTLSTTVRVGTVASWSSQGYIL